MSSKRLGKCTLGERLVVTAVEGDMIHSDFYEPRTRAWFEGFLGPFDFKPGQEYGIDFYDGGRFVTNNGITYFIPNEGDPQLIEENLDDYTARILEEEKRVEFETLLAEGKITAGYRVRAYLQETSIIEIALAEDSDLPHILNPYEAYTLLVNRSENTALIVESEFGGGPSGFFKKHEYDKSKIEPVQLPQQIIDAAMYPTENIFTRLQPDAIDFVRTNCYRPEPE